MKWIPALLLSLFCCMHACRAQNDSCSGANPPYPSVLPYCENFSAADSIQICYTFQSTAADPYLNPFVLTSCSAVDLTILLYHNGCSTADTGVVGYNSVIPNEPYTVCFKYVCSLNDGVFSGACFFSGLPIELLYFDARKVDDIVRLGWATASETNNDYFAVERSTNGKGFHQLGIVDGAGNSSVIQKYQYTDFIPYSENYYRLSQHDYDGKIQLSEIRYVKMTDDCIQVFDIFGRSIYIGSKKNFHPPSGIYIVWENQMYKKFIKP